ncbi:MAG: hypothetical protein PHU98_06280 [Mariniphaga sp.]|nr:hypothetical protein [Mariniphaga sp.]
MTKEAIGIKNYRTFKKTFDDLIEWGFIILIEKSKNQYSANIIAIVQNTKAHTKASTKALDKAIHNHVPKQSQSIVGIDIQDTIEPNNNITKPKPKPKPPKEEIPEIFYKISDYFFEIKSKRSPDLMKLVKYKPNRYKWAKALFDLKNIDGAEIYQIKAVLKFSITNEFWQKQIISLAGIRTKGKNDLSKFANCLNAVPVEMITRYKNGQFGTASPKKTTGIQPYKEEVYINEHTGKPFTPEELEANKIRTMEILNRFGK